MRLKSALTLLASVGLFLAVGYSQTHAATFASGDALETKIGDQIGSDFDQIIITGTSGSFLNAGQSGVVIGSGTFVVGVNCTTCTLTPSGNISQSLAINGGPTQNFVIHWDWSSTGPVDTLMLSIVTGLLNFGDYTALLHLSPTSLSSGLGSVGFTLTADILPTPLPAALPLFATGLGLVGFAGWRRKRKAKVALAGA